MSEIPNDPLSQGYNQPAVYTQPITTLFPL
ncbi:hypothetical protein BH11BAC7_BH11BAC7_36760 [soil metagenome]